MSYEQIKHLKESEFKRLCGVKPQTFADMVKILKQDLPTSRNRGGQPKLSIEDRLLIALEKRARVSNLFSYWSIMGSSRIDSMQNSSSSRRPVNQIKKI